MKWNKEAIIALAGFSITFIAAWLFGYYALFGDGTEDMRVGRLLVMAWAAAVMHSFLDEFFHIIDKRRPDRERIADLEARVAELEGRDRE